MKISTALIGFSTILLLSLSSCGQVHRFTKVKKIPREYSMNYCGDNIKAPKTDINKNPWIVYSDRANNTTYNNAGGKIKAKDINYLDAFLVIGKKKDYLKLIKYTPDILKNGKLEYKKAEYYGWIHKSKLLLNYQSMTDVSSNLKNKQIISFSDTTMFQEPAKFMANDSIKLYKDLKMEEQIGNVALYSIVYPLKTSEDGKKTLIAKVPELVPETILDNVLGWVDNSLVTDIGQVLHVDYTSLPDSTLILEPLSNDSLYPKADRIDLHTVISERYKTVKYSPIHSYDEREGQSAFKTRLNMPALDYSLNYIFNVNGGHINYRKYRSISQKLKQVNVIFLFDGKSNTIANFPQIVNALQNLQPLFEEKDDSFQYRFGCVMDFDTNVRSFKSLYRELDPDYSNLMDFLSDKANQKKDLRAINMNRSWGNLNTAFELIKNDKNATNLIIIIGETGYSSENVTKDIEDKLVSHNCRIAGFQIYAGDTDSYNNFVLNIESMITSYSDRMLKTKGDLLVSPKQLRPDNYFVQVGEEKNGYRLDFPNNSITEGAIFFPQKGEMLSLDILTNNVDTIIQQIRQDNNDIIHYMTTAFASAGNNRTRFDSLFAVHHRLNYNRMPPKSFISSFKNDLPGWSIHSQPILLGDSVRQQVAYKLLLNDSEMESLKEFIESLSKYEVDYIEIEASKKKVNRKKKCNCPEDNIFEEIERKKEFRQISNIPSSLSDTLQSEILQSDTIKIKGEYINTNKIRKYLQNIYINEIQYCKLCKENKRSVKKMTLAEAQMRITQCPSYSKELTQYTVENLRNKKVLTDDKLEELILYFKKMKEELDKAEKFESNGQTYYWVDKKLLP